MLDLVWLKYSAIFLYFCDLLHESILLFMHSLAYYLIPHPPHPIQQNSLYDININNY